jgi:hypothetical protein
MRLDGNSSVFAFLADISQIIMVKLHHLSCFSFMKISVDA